MSNVEKSKSESIKYWIVLTIEFIGFIIILIRGIPFYQTLKLRYETYTPESGGMFFAVLAILLIQIPYWYKQIKGCVPTVSKSNFMSTIIAFIARMFIIFAGAFFTILFLTSFDGWVGVPFYKFIIMLMVIFSIFCYCRDLEELAMAFKVRKIRD